MCVKMWSFMWIVNCASLVCKLFLIKLWISAYSALLILCIVLYHLSNDFSLYNQFYVNSVVMSWVGAKHQSFRTCSFWGDGYIFIFKILSSNKILNIRINIEWAVGWTDFFCSINDPLVCCQFLFIYILISSFYFYFLFTSSEYILNIFFYFCINVMPPVMPVFPSLAIRWHVLHLKEKRLSTIILVFHSKSMQCYLM